MSNKDNAQLLNTGYVEAWDGKWSDQKKVIEQKMAKQHPNMDIKVCRVRTDTKGLRNYVVWGCEKN